MPLAFWLMTPQHIACELAHQAGYDLVIFDQEHGTFTTADIERLLAFCRALGLAAYVRVNGAERIAIQQALDQGAAGVIIPQIQNLDHAREVTAFAKYPPLGIDIAVHIAMAVEMIWTDIQEYSYIKRGILR